MIVLVVVVVLLALAEVPWRSNRAAAVGDKAIDDIAALRRRRLLEEARRLSMVDIICSLCLTILLWVGVNVVVLKK